jgi:hypothetical protein
MLSMLTSLMLCALTSQVWPPESAEAEAALNEALVTRVHGDDFSGMRRSEQVRTRCCRL